MSHYSDSGMMKNDKRIGKNARDFLTNGFSTTTTTNAIPVPPPPSSSSQEIRPILRYFNFLPAKTDENSAPYTSTCLPSPNPTFADFSSPPQISAEAVPVSGPMQVPTVEQQTVPHTGSESRPLPDTTEVEELNQEMRRKRASGKDGRNKSCKCKKCKCLKRYCECRAAQSPCSDSCTCQNCENTDANISKAQTMRGKAESRHPADTKASNHKNSEKVASDEDGRNKRCACKTCKCSKRVCKCFAAGSYCSDCCTCQNCGNRYPNISMAQTKCDKAESRHPADTKVSNCKNSKKTATDKDGKNKSCTCKKSKCLKLYCECFAAGSYCSKACTCQNCENKKANISLVRAKREEAESRNPADKKACNCKNSKCLQNHCACYKGNKECSLDCRCVACQNSFGRRPAFPSAVALYELARKSNMPPNGSANMGSMEEIHDDDGNGNRDDNDNDDDDNNDDDDDDDDDDDSDDDDDNDDDDAT